MIKEVQHFKVTIRGNETTVERDRSYIDYKNNLRCVTTTCKSKNTESDTYNKKIGIVVSVLKTMGFSRRIIGKIVNILLEEDKRN
jgi:hypothetical protein